MSEDLTYTEEEIKELFKTIKGHGCGQATRVCAYPIYFDPNQRPLPPMIPESKVVVDWRVGMKCGCGNVHIKGFHTFEDAINHWNQFVGRTIINLSARLGPTPDGPIIFERGDFGD